MIGQMIGRYRVVRSIAAGGMGAVWRAHNIRVKKAVAIKTPAGA